MSSRGGNADGEERGACQYPWLAHVGRVGVLQVLGLLH